MKKNKYIRIIIFGVLAIFLLNSNNIYNTFISRGDGAQVGLPSGVFEGEVRYLMVDSVEGVKIKENSTVLSKTITTAKEGELLEATSYTQKYYFITTEEGVKGYVPKDEIKVLDIEMDEYQQAKELFK